MNQAEWFYELLSDEHGPVTIDHIRDMIDSGTLGPTDRIRHSSSDAWLEVGQLPRPEVADADVDELSDLSELSFSFGDSDEAAEESPDLDELDIDSFNISSESDEGDDDANQDDMDIDGFRIEGDTQERPARPTVAAEPNPKAAAEELYLVESLGQELGPMPLAEVVSMAQSGALSEADKIRSSSSSDWISPVTIPEVAMGILAAARTAQAESEAASKAKLQRRKAAAKKKPTKRKKAKKDELLAEIFSEVFAEDGKVKEDRDPTRNQAGASSPAAPVAAATPAPPNPAIAEASSPAMPSVPTEPPSPTAAAPPPPQPPAPPAYQPPTPRPMPRPPMKKSSGGGGGFQMPEPKVLGIIGGVVAVVLVVGLGLSGFVSLPGLAPDVDGFVNSVVTEYKTISAGPIPPDKWSALKSRVSSEGRAIITHYSKSGQLTAEDNKKRWAVAKLIELLSCDPADKEKQASVFEAFQKLRGG